MIGTVRSCKVALAGVALAVSVSGALAGEMKAAGTVTYVVVPMSKAALAGGGSADQNHLRGVILSRDPTSPLHLNAQDCTGTTINDVGGAPVDGGGSCMAVDKDGDVWWLWYRNKGAERNWTVIGGTGKFAGMSGTGTTTVLAATADGRLTISYQGTMQMK